MQQLPGVSLNLISVDVRCSEWDGGGALCVSAIPQVTVKDGWLACDNEAPTDAAGLPANHIQAEVQTFLKSSF